MPKVVASPVIDAPIEQVWVYVRDFHRLREYQSSLVECGPDGELKGDQIGCRRVAMNNLGQRTTEELLALSDIEHSGQCRLVEVDAPIINYIGSFRLWRITDSNRTFIEWSGIFDYTGEGDVAPMMTFIEQAVYVDCFNGLKALARQAAHS
jgi:hypothetical protein